MTERGRGSEPCEARYQTQTRAQSVGEGGKERGGDAGGGGWAVTFKRVGTEGAEGPAKVEGRAASVAQCVFKRAHGGAVGRWRLHGRGGWAKENHRVLMVRPRRIIWAACGAKENHWAPVGRPRRIIPGQTPAVGDSLGREALSASPVRVFRPRRIIKENHRVREVWPLLAKENHAAPAN